MVQPLWRAVQPFHWKTKDGLTMWPSKRTLGHIIPEKEKYIFMQKHGPKRSTAASVGEWPRYTQTIGYYSALKRNGVLIHSITWLTLEEMKQNGKSQSQRICPVWLHLYDIQSCNHRDRKQIVVAKGWSGCGMKYLDRDSDYRQLGFTHGIKLHSSLQTHIHMRESQYKPGKIWMSSVDHTKVGFLVQILSSN